MLYSRTLEFDSLLKRRSIFLLGPRQTGKSTLLRERFPQAQYLDLLESDTFRTLSAAPEMLRGWIKDLNGTVIVDEIQKLPILLDEVQLLLDRNKNLRFILTGSSARKLKRGHANLLGGRALFLHLYPLTTQELGPSRFEDMIQRGGLPGIIDSEIYWEELKSYVGIYLKEEIQAEGLTRSIENFSRFLDFAAHFNAEQMNYTKIGNDAEISPRTIKDYVKILEDTLIAHILPPYRSKRGRKTVATEKFYFFDIGVTHALQRRRSIEKQTLEYGKALEQLVFLELKAKINYQNFDCLLTYWRTHTQLEVDFLIDDDIAIEVKGTGRVASSDLKPLRALAEDVKVKRRIVVCLEKHVRKTDDGIEIIPAPIFFQMLWAGEILCCG